MVYNVFMVFGDSITQKSWEPGLDGFGQKLSSVYARKFDVINRGFSGYNTEWALPIFQKFFPKQTAKHAETIRVLTIWFGANDACVKPSPQHVPLARFINNIKEMLEMVRSPDSLYYSPSTRIILITPPPVNTHQRGPDRVFNVTKEYADAVRNIAIEEGIALVDVWTVLWKAAGENERALSKFLHDGLHLSKEGYELMYEELISVIGKVHPEVHYDNIRNVFPLWDEIDWKSYAKGLESVGMVIDRTNGR